jgi:hypothetical protein
LSAKLLSLLAAAMLACAPALAYDEPDRCYSTSPADLCNPVCANTFYNPDATQNWMQTRQLADPKVMGQLAGVYYGEFPDPSGRPMVNQAYREYDLNGGWQYQDQTCTIGSPMPCSTNQGAGPPIRSTTARSS